VIAGPTASGKTALGVALARQLHGEIIGADSVQVYRGFDIGSAKPTADELDGLPHHLVSILEPTSAIDAADYATHADDAIEAVTDRGHVPIVVGGTGLWIRTLVYGLVDAPRPDVAVRARLEEEAARAGAAQLHVRLGEVDPASASTIHPNDVLRIVRALEVYEQTGVPLGELRRAHGRGEPRYRTLFIVLEESMDVLTERIEARVDAMLERGWVDEVRALLERFPPSARAFGSVGYRQLVEHLQGSVPLDEARLRIRTATRTYARRQRTWFNGERGVHWRASASNVWAERARIHAFLSEAAP
jgi:tRNA dimethylallyltransferase